MKINQFKKSYINVSGNIYDSEFINLANIKKNKVSLDEKTLFLSDDEKKILNSQEIKGFNDAVYVFKKEDAYGIICDLPISEYNDNKVECHELVLPDIIQGMLSNLHLYNCETAPILLGHNGRIDYIKYIRDKKYKDYFKFNNIDIYVFCGDDAKEILNEFIEIDKLYVADGHHRLYSTSLATFKDSVLACLISFDYLDILPIHRIIRDVDNEVFSKAKKFMYNKFYISSEDDILGKGKVKIKYNDEKFMLNLIDLNSDAFWNNDIYRLNTQVISQAFRIFDTGKLDYILDNEIKKENKINKNDVLIETYPISKTEFIECMKNKCIMPPKSTCFLPKFPSFLIFKQYKE